MLRPVIQNATPSGSKMFDEKTKKIDSETENIFAQMKDFDAKNEIEDQKLTKENLDKLSFYLQKSAANFQS